MTIDRPPRVFISYSHDSLAHAARVRELADALRANGVDAWIDQYEAAPVEGWARWMVRQVEAATHIITVMTPTYRERFDAKVAKGGLGVSFEGMLITQLLYEARGRNHTIVPVVFDGTDPAAAIPLVLRPYQYFNLPEGLDELVGHIWGFVKAPAPPLGSLPGFEPKPQRSLGSSDASPSIGLVIRLEGTPEGISPKVAQIEQDLRSIARDDSITVIGVTSGSARLVIVGDIDALRRVATYLRSGECTSVAGAPLLDFNLHDVAPPYLSPKTIRELLSLAIKHDLDSKRAALLGSLPRLVRNGLPNQNDSVSQMVSDLQSLNEMPALKDGTLPITVWLEYAALLTENFECSDVFQRYASQLSRTGREG